MRTCRSRKDLTISRLSKLWNSDKSYRWLASLTIYSTRSASIVRLILNSVRLTHNKRHAATTPS